MNGRQPVELARKMIYRAGEALSRARALLLQPTPQNLDIACSALETSIRRVNELQGVLVVSSSRELMAAAVGLRQEVTLISRMLEHAASYHSNLLQAMIEGYRSDVQPVPSIGPSRRMSLDA